MLTVVLDLFHFELNLKVKLNFYMHSKAGMWHHVGSTMKIVRNTLFLVGDERQRGRKRKITHYFIGHSDSGHTRRRKSFAASRYLCMVKISGFQITQFIKRRGQTME